MFANSLNPGCDCCGGAVVLTTLEPTPDCHGGVPNTHVTITRVSDSTVVFDGNTSVAGRISVTLTAGASYVMTIDGYGPPRWQSSRTFVGPSGTGVFIIILNRSAGYICHGNCGYPLSNRLFLDGARDSPVLLSTDGPTSYFPTDAYRAVVATEGTYSMAGGNDAYGAFGNASNANWQLDVHYDPGSGDPLSEDFSLDGTVDCSDFLVTFPHSGAGGAPDWTITEAPPVP